MDEIFDYISGLALSRDMCLESLGASMLNLIQPTRIALKLL
jgi:hypothetical protein